MNVEYIFKLNFISLYFFSLQKMKSELDHQKVNLLVKLIVGNPVTVLFICIYSVIKKRSFIFKPFYISISEKVVKSEVINEEDIYSWEDFTRLDNLKTYLILEFDGGQVVIPKKKITETQKLQLSSFIDSL